MYRNCFVLVCITAAFLVFQGGITPLSAQAWIQKGGDLDGEASNDNSGYSVSMPDANTVAIGAPYNNGGSTGSGHVRVYRWSGSGWVQKGSDIDGEAAYDNSGYSVSMPDSNTVAVGAPYNDGNGTLSGHVRVYQWNGSAWVQKGGDIDGEATYDYSGYSVSMPDANTVAIGAPYNDGNGSFSGHVRIYQWSGSAWVQKGGDIDGEAAGDRSGYSVSMPNANTVAIGAYLNDGGGNDAGHVRIYQWNGSAWVQKGGDIDGEAANDQSGWSVSMPDANTVAIGAIYNDGNGSNSGHVRIYQWSGSAWIQKGGDIDGAAAFDQLGYSVSMPNANTVAVGAPENDSNGSNSGHVRIYQWTGSTWAQKGLTINGEASYDFSGWAVSMGDANTVSIGAVYNDGGGYDAGHVRIYKWDPQPDVGAAAHSMDGCGLGSSEPIWITVHNYGMSLSSGTNVSYSVTVDGGTPCTGTLTIGPGGLAYEADTTFNSGCTGDFSSVGSHTVKAWTSLAGDVDTTNDTATSTVTHHAATSLTWADGFENNGLSEPNSTGEDTLAVGWHVSPGGNTGTYRWMTEDGHPAAAQTGPSAPYSGTRYVYVESTPSTGTEAILMSRCVDISTAPAPHLIYAYHMYGAGMGDLHVEIQEAGSRSWNALRTWSGQQQTAQGDAWKIDLIDLNGYTSPVRLRFRGTRSPGGSSAGQGDMALDSIQIKNVQLDVEVSAVDSPISKCTLGNSEPIWLTIHNNDTALMTGMMVPYSIQVDGSMLCSGALTVGPGGLANGADTTFNTGCTGDFSVPVNHIVKAWTSLTGDGDVTNDTATQTIEHHIAPTLGADDIFVDDFECFPALITQASGTLLMSGTPSAPWEYTHTYNGRLHTAYTNHTTNGARAVTFDAYPTGPWSDNWMTVTLDMSSYNTATNVVGLSFWWTDHNDETHSGDTIAIRGSSADPWIKVKSLTPGSHSDNTWQQETINLTSALQAAGQSFSSTFQMRFSQRDNFPLSSYAPDGISYDDIRVFHWPDDVRVAAVDSPVTSCYLGSNEPVWITIANYGNFLSAGEKVPYTIEVNGGTPCTDTFVVPTGGFPSGADTTFNSGCTGDFSAIDTHTVKAWTTLSGDSNPANDTASTLIGRRRPSLGPYDVFKDDFECLPDLTTSSSGTVLIGGNPSVQWIYTNTTSYSRLATAFVSPFTMAVTNHTAGGARAVTLYGSGPAGASFQNWLTVTLDMSGYNVTTDVITLEFWWLDHSDSTDPEDKIMIRGNNSAPWITVKNLNPQLNPDGTWKQESIAISPLLEGAGQNFSSTFQIRFGEEDQIVHVNNVNDWDGISYDDVHVYVLPPDVGASAVDSPIGGCSLSSSEPIWITIHNYGDHLPGGTHIPYTVRVNGGALCTDTFTVPAGRFSYDADTTFNSGCTGDFSSLGAYTVEVWTSMASDVDPTNDLTTRTIRNNPVPTLGNNDIFVDNFECFPPLTTQTSGTILMGGVPSAQWEYTNTSTAHNRGRLSTTMTNHTPSGSQAVTMYPYPSAYWHFPNNWMTVTLDMSSYNVTTDTVELTFWWTDHNDVTQAGDSVAIRGSNSAPWINVKQLDPSNNSGWTQEHIRLSHVLQAAGQNFSNTFQIRFSQTGQKTIPWNGISYDDIRVYELLPDVGVSMVDSPVSQCGLGSNEPIWITIHNDEIPLNAGGAVPYRVQVDGGTICTGTLTIGPGGLATGADTTFNSGCSGNFSTPGNHTVKAWTALTVDMDVSNDTTTHIIEHKAGPTLGPDDIFVDDWECLSALTTQTSGTVLMSGSPLSPWTYTHTNNGRLTTDYTNHTTSGARAVTFDMNPAGAGANNCITATLDLSSYNATTDVLGLMFWWTDHSDSTDQGDSIAIRGSSSDAWINVLYLDPESHPDGTWNPTHIDLSRTLQGAGQNFSSTFEMRFCQYGRSALPLNGISYDDFQVYEVPLEVGVSAVDSPVSGCNMGNSEPVWITIHNYGSALAAGTPIPYSVQVDGGTPCMGTLTVPIGGFATGADTTFNSGCAAGLSILSSHTIEAWTALAGDRDSTNDTTSVLIFHDTMVSIFPYMESFESGTGGWRVESNGNTTWARGELHATPSPGTIDTAAEGSFAWETDTTGNYNASEQGWVLSPCFDFSGITNMPKLTMSIWWDSKDGQDGGAIDTGNISGNNWGRLGQYGASNNWYNDSSISGLNWSGSQHGWSGTGSNSSGGWGDVSYIIPEFTGRSGYVRFRMLFGSTGSISGDGFAFDHVRIGELPMDVGVNAVDSPVSGCSLNSSVPVWLTIHNHGIPLSSGTSIPYSVVVDGGTPCTDTLIIGAGGLAWEADTTFNSGCIGDFNTLGNHPVKAWTGLSGDTSKTNDTLTTTVTNMLPPLGAHDIFVDDFECLPASTTQTSGTVMMSGNPSSQWEYTNTATGRLQTAYTNHTAGGAQAITFDNTNWHIAGNNCMTTTLDMSAYNAASDAIKLRFWWTDHNDWTDAGDSIAVRGSHTDPWVNVMQLNPDGHPDGIWTQEIINLTSILQAAGQNFSSTFEMRFCTQSYNIVPTDGISYDDIRVYAVPLDVGITAVDSPTPACNLGSGEPIWLTIRNDGNALAAGTPIPYIVQVDGGTPCMDTLTVPVGGFPIGADTTFNSGCTADLSAVGDHTVKAWTSLSGDSDSTNDTTNTIVAHDPVISTFPYTESFESGAGGWRVESSGTTTWALGELHATATPNTIDTAADGTYAWETNTFGYYNDNEKGWVISPCFDFSGLTNAPKLTMAVWWDSWHSWNGGAIDTGDMLGSNWGRLGQSGDSNNWYNDNTINGLSWTGNQHGWTGTGSNGSGGWVDASRLISAFAGRSGYVRFRVLFGSTGGIWGDGFAFDHVRIGDVPMDVGVSAVDSPVAGCELTGNKPIWITIHNYNTAIAAGSLIPYSVQVDSTAICTDTLTVGTGGLANGADTTFNSGCTGDFSTMGSHTVKAWSSLSRDAEAANDTTIQLIEHRPLPILGGNDIFIDNFECFRALATQTSGTILMSGNPYSPWTYTNTNNGRLQTAYTNHTSGDARSATLDAAWNSSSFSNNWMTVTLDLSTYDTASNLIKLVFWWTDHGDDYSYSGDEIDIRGDSSASWINVKGLSPWNNPDGTWKQETIDLHSALQAAGQNFSSTFQIRFGQNDNNTVSSYSDPDGISYDDIRVFEVPLEVGMTAVDSPVSACNLGAGEPVWLRLHNYGSTLAPGTTIPYSVQVDGGTPCMDTLTIPAGGLPIGADTTFQSGCMADLSTVGYHTLKAWTSLSGDSDSTNDTTNTLIVHDPVISTFPYTESFESGTGGWRVESNGTTTWALGQLHATASPGTIDSAAEGSFAWETDTTGNYNASEQGWVLSPCFDFSGMTNAPKLTISVWWDSKDGQDGGAIDTSSISESNWGRLGQYGTSNNWYNDSTISGLNWSGSQHGWSGTGSNSSGGWSNASHIIPEFTGRSGYVRFRMLFGSTGSISGDGFAFDHVRISEAPRDVGVSAVDSPITGCNLDSIESVWLTIYNHETPLSSGATIPYSVVVDGGMPCTDTLIIGAGGLAWKADTTFNSGCTGNFNTPGDHTVKAWTDLPGDTSKANDTTSTTVTNTRTPLGTHDIFIDDFECPDARITQTPQTWMSGNPLTPWEYTNNNYGRLQTAYTNYTTGGDRAVTFDAAPSGGTSFSSNWMTATLDMSSYDAALHLIKLEFQWTDHGDETHAGDTIAIRGSASDRWILVIGLNPANNADGSWNQGTINLSDELQAAGQNFSSTFQIRFSQHDNNPVSGADPDGISYDNIRVYEMPPDVAVTAVDSPVAGCGLTSNEPVWLTIHNYTGSLVAGTTIPYSVQVDGGTPCIDTLIIPAGGLAIGADTTFQSSCTADLSTTGYHTLKAWTSMADDADVTNDTASQTLYNDTLISTFPYVESFESGVGGWRVKAIGTSTWALGQLHATASPGTIDTAADGTYAWETNPAGSYSYYEKGGVLSPCFDFSGMTNAPKLTMAVWWESKASQAGGAIDTGDISESNWGRLGQYGDPNNWYNDNAIIGLNWTWNQHGWSGTGSNSSGGWVEASRTISEFAGRSGYVRFRVVFGATGSISGDGFAFDHVRIGEVPMDVGISAVDSPVAGCGLTGNEPIWITIHNYNTAIAAGSLIPYSVQVDSAAICTDTLTVGTGGLANGADTTFNTGCTGDFSTLGNHTVKAWTYPTSDQDPTNDTTTTAIFALPTYSTFPHVEGFEGAHYWQFGGTNSSWQVGTPSGGDIDAPGEGAQSLLTNNGSDAYNNSEESWAMSPCYDLSGLFAAPVMSFLHAWEIESNQDAGWVEYTTDGGATWTKVGVWYSGVNWYNDAANDWWDATNGHEDWHVASYVLGAPWGSSHVQFRFRLSTNNSGTYEGMAIDQFSILPGWTEVFNPSARPYTDSSTANLSGNGWTKYQVGGNDVLWIDPNGNNLGNTDMKVETEFPPQYFPSVSQYMTPRHWVVEPTTQPTSNITLRLFLTEEEWDTLRNRDADLTKGIHLLGITHYHGPNDHTLSWSDNSYTGTNRVFIDPSNITVYPWNNGYGLEFDVQVMSQFGGNSGAGTNTPLPVEFAWFRADRVGRDALLRWATASERGSDHFRVEVATEVRDGKPVWRLLGTVKAAGESRELREYEFVDREPNKRGMRYYRIVEVDADGTTTESPVRKLFFDGKASGVTVRPNPFTDALEVLLPSGEGTAQVQVKDARGVTVWRSTVTLGGVAQTARVDASALPAGVYMVRVTTASGSEIIKVVKR